MPSESIHVEVWSDLVCPFCYIGKRRLQQAIERFEAPAAVQVQWRSFQLRPDQRPDPARNALQHLAERRGWTQEQTQALAADLGARALDAGIVLDYERTVVANTFDAHRLTHLAASLGAGDALLERLFAGYFCEGMNLADPAALEDAAERAGIRRAAAALALATGAHADDVRQDLERAQQLGIQGVPFFVFDRRLAVSGAQSADVLLEALRRCAASSPPRA